MWSSRTPIAFQYGHASRALFSATKMLIEALSAASMDARPEDFKNAPRDCAVQRQAATITNNI